MRLAFIVTGSLMLFGVAACSGFSGTSATGGTPVGAASTAPANSSGMPQPPNSLPAGSAINAPVTNNTGKVGTTAY